MAEKIKTQNDEIDVMALLRLCLKKWYIFAIAVGVCCVLAVAYYMTAEPQYKTTATLMLRSQDMTSPLANISIGGFTAADIMGGGRNVDNEIEVMRSRELLRQTIESLDMRTISKRKMGLRKIDQYGKSPLLMTCPEGFDSAMKGSLKVEVERCDDGQYKLWFKRKIKRSTERYKCTAADIASVETPWGIFHFAEQKENIIMPNADDVTDSTYTMFFYVANIKSRIDKMSEELNIASVSKKNNAISITYTSGSPEKNERLINRIIDLYNLGEQSDNTHVQGQSARFLATRLSQSKQDLLDIEQDIEDYKERNNIADIQVQAEINLTTTSEYEKQIAAADIQYNLVSFVEDYLRNASDDDLIPNNTGINDESLGTMMANYNSLVLKYLRMNRATNATNPIVDRTLNEIRLLRQNILQTISNVKESLVITKRDLKAKSKRYENQVSQVPSIEREYRELVREREIQQTIYIGLQQKYELALLQEASTVETMRIIDPVYTFEKPVKPQAKMLLVVAVLLGLIIASGYLYVKENFFTKKEEESSENVVAEEAK